MTSKRTFSYALLGGLSLFLALQGCSDDGDENPTPPDITPEGGSGGSSTSGSGGKAGGGKNTGGSDAEDGGTNNTGNVGGGDPVPAGGEGGGGPVQPACDLPELGTDGCFNCPLNGETEQWLNRCLETDCEPFDNSRLPQLEDDGALPDLP